MMAANTLLIRPRSGRTVPLSSYVLAVLWGAYSCRLFRIDYPLNFCWSWPNWSWHCQIPCSVLVMERYSISGILRPEARVTWKDAKIWLDPRHEYACVFECHSMTVGWWHGPSNSRYRHGATWHHRPRRESTKKKEEQRVSWPPLIEAKGVIEAEPQGGTNRLIMDHASN